MEEVAPLAGAWIEMIAGIRDGRFERVAPLAGAWIEIDLGNDTVHLGTGRSPRGSVD